MQSRTKSQFEQSDRDDALAPLWTEFDYGAEPNEVIVGDSTSECQFKLTAAVVKHQGKRRTATDEANFPTDPYTLSGLQEVLGGAAEAAPVPLWDLSHSAGADRPQHHRRLPRSGTDALWVCPVVPVLYGYLGQWRTAFTL